MPSKQKGWKRIIFHVMDDMVHQRRKEKRTKRSHICPKFQLMLHKNGQGKPSQSKRKAPFKMILTPDQKGLWPLVILCPKVENVSIPDIVP